MSGLTTRCTGAQRWRSELGWTAAVTAAVTLTLAPVTPCRAQIPRAVEHMLSSAGLPSDALAYVALRADSGERVAGAASSRPMQPASTLKLLTAAVALDRLGLTWRSRSELATDGIVIGDTLHGNLLLRGYGDTDFDVDAFRRMLQRLRDRGVREIRGDLLLVRDWFAPARPDAGVPPFDETPEFRYNAIPDALFLNSNLLQLDLVADASTVRVRSEPQLPGVAVVGKFALVDRPCDDWEDGWQAPEVASAGNGEIEVRLRGEFPRHCVVTTKINVLDRTEFAARLFRALWWELGGTFAGAVREAPSPSAATLLQSVAEHRSRPLAEVLRDINKRSDNPITRLTFLALAERTAPDDASATTASAAEVMVRRWLRNEGIDDTGLVLDNGSGLSRSEKISPLQLALVVRAAMRKPWAPEFMASLPVVGIDGGMARRLRDTALVGHARFKTGTLRDVTALAGYLPDADGNRLVVVAMLNHARATARVAQPILDALMRELAGLGGARGDGAGP